MVETEVSWDQEPIMAALSPVGYLLCSCNSGAVATGEDPTSVAIASIQSAATFPDPNVKYVFRTENGGQVREGARWLQVFLGVGIEGGR